HFYAMQFIEGRTLAAVIQELQGKPGLDSEGSLGPTPRPSSGTPTSEATPAGPTPGVARAGEATATASPTPEPGALPGDPSGELRGSSSRGPAFFRAAARLGVQAAEALEHAHALGVLHRDIKPANLMIDGRGDLWVTDFGLARVQGEAGITRTGEML